MSHDMFSPPFFYLSNISSQSSSIILEIFGLSVQLRLLLGYVAGAGDTDSDFARPTDNVSSNHA